MDQILTSNAIPLCIVIAALLWCVGLLYRTRGENEPPQVSYWIPWLGNGLHFQRDTNDFVEWAKKNVPNHAIRSLTLGGRRMYLITDVNLASQVYRQSRTYAFDPFALLVCVTLGGSKEDLKILEIGAHDVSRNLDENAGPGILHALSSLTVTDLRGASLDQMTDVFMKHFFMEIDKEFPDTPEGGEWRTLDLCEFLKRAWTMASIISLFGTEIVKQWPRVYHWMWEFDDNMLLLFAQLPRFAIPTAYRLRDEGRDAFLRWEAAAIEATEQKLAAKDSLWDPYWGMKHTRERLKIAHDGGLGAIGGAALQVALLWGQNANAVPCAIWIVIQALANPETLMKVQNEIRLSAKGPSSISISKLVEQKYLKSLLLETYRWGTGSPTLRVLQKPTTLGGYSLQAGAMVFVHARSLQMADDIWDVPGQPGSEAVNFLPERFVPTDDGLGEADFEAQRVEESTAAKKNYLHGETAKVRTAEVAASSKSRDMQRRMLAMRHFGGGQTLCPGRHFATNEILGGMAALMMRLEIEIDEEALKKNGFPQPDLVKQGGLFPDRAFQVRVRRREKPL